MTDKRHVRVLWDIENIRVSGKNGGALETISKLQKFVLSMNWLLLSPVYSFYLLTLLLNSFLQSKCLFGTGIDCRITAFFAPNNSTIPSKVIEELDKAAVELVKSSSSLLSIISFHCFRCGCQEKEKMLIVNLRIESHKKLKLVILLLLICHSSLLLTCFSFFKVLSPSCASFVVITSDQDYRHHFQSLRNSGYSIIVIHNASSSNWINVMELHSTEAYHWNDIMTSPSTSSSTSTSTTELKQQPKKKHSKPKRKQQSNEENVPTESNTTNPETEITNESAVETPTDWLQGVCTYWKAGYGFCRGNSSLFHLSFQSFIIYSFIRHSHFVAIFIVGVCW